MKAIILGAGKPAFSDLPVSNLEVSGERLLDIQISCLRSAGIDQIHLATGYRAPDVRRADIETRCNPLWLTAGSVSSLKLFSDLFDGADDVLLMYGDTLFEPWIIESVARGALGISAACFLDRTNRDLGRYREYARLDAGTLMAVSDDSTEHGVRTVFTGIVLVKRHCAAIMHRYMDEVDGAAHVGFLLDLMLRRGIAVTPVIVEHGWVELSSDSFYQDALAQAVFLERVIQIHTDWAQRAKAYDKLEWVNNDALLAAMTRLAQELQPTRVLDVGTGSGKVLLAIRNALSDGEYWGVDTSQAMLDRIPVKDGLRLYLCDAESLAGIPHDHFHLVTARMVFHHIHDTARAINSIHQVLKDGGCVAVCEGVPPSLGSIKWYTEMFRYKEDRKTLTEVDLINLLVRAGFIDVQTRTIIMRNASLNNWLDNAGIPARNVEIIKEMHIKAPHHVKEDYDMRFVDGDCLMTWKFALTTGFKPAKVQR